MKEEEVSDLALAGNADAAALKEAMLSAEFVQALQDRIEASPAERRRRELVVEYGERHGGTTLQFLQMFDGAYWRTGLELTLEQCATVLGVPAGKLEAMYDEMLDEIRPHLLEPAADPEVERTKLRSLFTRRHRENGAAAKPRSQRSGVHDAGRGKRRGTA